MNNQRITALFATLGETNDDLLSILDDLWLEIDHTDPESIKLGAERMVSIVKSVQEFQSLAERIRKDISAFGATVREDVPEEGKAPSPVEVISDKFAGRSEVSLSSNWSYKRPFGFKLLGEEHPFRTTWIDLYIEFCLCLRKIDMARFESLPDRAVLISTHGNRYFSRSRADLRAAHQISETVWMETNLSAKLIRDNIRKLCGVYSIPEAELKVFIRQE